jgi:peptidoglycan hydrolase CwlO-like protein
MRRSYDDLKQDENYYQSQIDFLEQCINDSFREIESYKRQLKFHRDELKTTQEDLETLEKEG